MIYIFININDIILIRPNYLLTIEISLSKVLIDKSPVGDKKS